MVCKKNLILVIDDEINIQITLSLVLSRAGYQVITLMNNPDTIKKILQSNIDLVIIDCEEGNNDKLSFLSEIRHCLADAPIIVMTQNSSVEINNCLVHIDQCLLIEKPINPQKILEVIANVLGKPKVLTSFSPID